MTHRKGAVWTERVILALILASLAGTLNLVLAIHRRVQSSAVASRTPSVPPPPAPVKDPQIAGPIAPPPPVPPTPAPPVIPPKPPEDPTAPILARMQAAIARETEAAREADRKAAAMEKAARTSIAESQRWKRREMLVRQQVAELSRRADKLEQDAITIDAERDVLARERDELKAALARDSQHSGYAVLPYKGPNGTWRRPIVLECTGNMVKLQPKGPTFSMLELSPLISPRQSPVVLAIAREMMKIQRGETPDGAPAVPYLVFLVRPDGVRPYYQVRGRLEPLGIAFGYELIEQDLAVDIPDFDDVRTWDGTIPLDVAESKPRGDGASPIDLSRKDESRQGAGWPGSDRPAATGASNPGTWPPAGDSGEKPGSDRRWPDLARGDGPGDGLRGRSGSLAGGSGDAGTPEIDLGGSPGRGGPSGGGASGEGSPDDFVWPTTSGGASPAGVGGSGRPAGRPPAGGGGGQEGVTGMAPGGLTGLGSTRSGGMRSSGGGRAGSDRMGPPQAATGGSGNVGQTAGSPEPGHFLAPSADSGRATISSPGGGTGRGGMPSGRAGATGSGGGNSDSLPELEPARDGPSSFGTPMPAGPSGGGGSGGGRSGRSGSPPSLAMGGTSPSATGLGGSGRPPASMGGQAGHESLSAGRNGTGSPGQGGSGLGSLSDESLPGNAGGGNAASEDTAPGGGTGADGRVGAGQAGSSGGLVGSTGSTRSANGGKPPGSGSATISGMPSSSAGSPSDSPPPLAWNAVSGSGSPSDPGRPPTPLQAATGPRLPSGSTSAGGLLGSLGDATDSSSAGASGSQGSASASSSASSSGAPGQSGGQPPSAISSVASGLSLPSFNTSPSPDSEPDGLKDLTLPHIETHRQPGAIDVPFEIVVVCRRDDLLLHPGGYRITSQSLQPGGGKGDGGETLLQSELKTIVRRRAQVDPLIRPKPRLKFLVEAGGASTFWKARQQLTFSNLDWPMTVQVAGPQSGYLLDERIRQ